MANQRRIALAVTGASGAAYGLRLLEVLLGLGEHVELMISAPGRMCIEMEAGLKLPARPAEVKSILISRYGSDSAQLDVYGKEEWFAPVASGSNPPSAMVVCPCTSGTLASVAAGYGKNLIDRAADVAIKEGRKLVLVIREMPFSVIHLQNMLRLARLGVVIMPANPGFYQNPKTIEDLVDFVVARILDHLDIEHELLPRWGEERT